MQAQPAQARRAWSLIQQLLSKHQVKLVCTCVEPRGTHCKQDSSPTLERSVQRTSLIQQFDGKAHSQCKLDQTDTVCRRSRVYTTLQSGHELYMLVKSTCLIGRHRTQCKMVHESSTGIHAICLQQVSMKMIPGKSNSRNQDTSKLNDASLCRF